MVDALREAWRVLRPSGQLLDLRPYAAPWRLEISGQAATRTAGFIDGSLKKRDDIACDAALDHMLNAGYFRKETMVLTDHPYFFSTLPAFLTYLATHWPDTARLLPETQRALMLLWPGSGRGAHIVVRRPLLLGIYRRLTAGFST